MRSVEVELKSQMLDGSHSLIFDGHGSFQHVPLGSTWKSDAMGGSKSITLMAQTFSMGELMSAKLSDSDDGTKLRMVVKLEGEPTRYV